MKRTSRFTPGSLFAVLLTSALSSAHADSLPACLMSIASPGVCLTQAIECAGSGDTLSAVYGAPVAALCAARQAQEAQAHSTQSLLTACTLEKDTQADAFASQLTTQEAARIDGVKALARADQKIRALKRQLRAARRSS